MMRLISPCLRKVLWSFARKVHDVEMVVDSPRLMRSEFAPITIKYNQSWSSKIIVFVTISSLYTGGRKTLPTKPEFVLSGKFSGSCTERECPGWRVSFGAFLVVSCLLFLLSSSAGILGNGLVAYCIEQGWWGVWSCKGFISLAQTAFLVLTADLKKD